MCDKYKKFLAHINWDKNSIVLDVMQKSLNENCLIQIRGFNIIQSAPNRF